jgi:c-di-GMP-binding flagellar brake protein YcgR
MADEEKKERDRRRFPRLSSPVYYRIAKSQALRQRVSNISLGGVRIYSDHRFDVGEQVELELHFPSGFSGKGTARVVWIKDLPPESGTNYDVGLEFVHLPQEAIQEILEALKDKK